MDSQHNITLGIGEAADLAGCSRDTIRRAAQKGELKAEMGPGVRGPQWWISQSDLLIWLEGRDTDAELSTATQHRSSTAAPQQSRAEHSTAAQHEADWTLSEGSRSSSLSVPEAASPPAEVYIALIDRLSRAERRSVELELALRQSQRLLSENAESITEKEALAAQVKAQLQEAEETHRIEAEALLEREARIKEAEVERLAQELAAVQEARDNHQAAEQAKALELARLSAELESTRQQLLQANQKPKGFFSWLGLRKKRSTTISVDKAV